MTRPALFLAAVNSDGYPCVLCANCARARQLARMLVQLVEPVDEGRCEDCGARGRG